MDAIQRSVTFTDSQVPEQNLRQWWDEREVALARCMKEAGFEYFPTLFEGSTDSAAPRDYNWVDRLMIPLLDTSRDLVSARGYGVTDTSRKAGTDESSPNQDYVDALSSGRRSQYAIAMYGEDTYSPNYDPYNSVSGGCSAKVELEHPDPELTGLSEDVTWVFSDQTSEIALFFTAGAVAKDARTIALNREWRACMTSAGVAIDSFLGAVPESETGSGPLGAFWMALHVARDGAVAPLSTLDDELPGDQRDLVGSQAEIDIALADFDCREKTDYVVRLTDIQRSLEDVFVADRRSALDEMLAYVDQQVG